MASTCLANFAKGLPMLLQTPDFTRWRNSILKVIKSRYSGRALGSSSLGTLVAPKAWRLRTLKLIKRHL